MTANNQVPDLDGSRIVETLFRNIAELINGNHVQASELVKVESRHCQCKLKTQVEWSFSTNTEETRFTGNTAAAIHFGYNKSAYQDETLSRTKIGQTNTEIRVNFLEKLLKNPDSGLGESTQSITAWSFGQHSVHSKCSNCRGDGRVICSACSGRGTITCYYCNGNGSTLQTRYFTDSRGQAQSEHYQQNCNSCWSSGRTACGTCNRDCYVDCSNCNGQGFFTDVATVSVVATPKINTTVSSKLSQGEFLEFLGSLPQKQIVDHFKFVLTGSRDIDINTGHFYYEAIDTIVEIDLQLRSKNYIVAAVGNNALPFIKPSIFDDLFIEEINDTKSIWSAKKKDFSADRAVKFFETYSGQPILDRVMKVVAQAGSNKLNTSGQLVSIACNGYISKPAAEILESSVQVLLAKISPPSSVLAWGLVLVIPFLLIFFVSQNWFEMNNLRTYTQIFISFIFAALVAVFFTVLVSPIAALASTITSSYQRRSIPIEYRQSGNNWLPFKRFIWISILVVFLGCSFGMASSYGFIPRINNLPIQTLLGAFGVDSWGELLLNLVQK